MQWVGGGRACRWRRSCQSSERAPTVATGAQWHLLSPEKCPPHPSWLGLRDDFPVTRSDSLSSEFVTQVLGAVLFPLAITAGQYRVGGGALVTAPGTVWGRRVLSEPEDSGSRGGGGGRAGWLCMSWEQKQRDRGVAGWALPRWGTVGSWLPGTSVSQGVGPHSPEDGSPGDTQARLGIAPHSRVIRPVSSPFPWPMPELSHLPVPRPWAAGTARRARLLCRLPSQATCPGGLRRAGWVRSLP